MASADSAEPYHKWSRASEPKADATLNKIGLSSLDTEQSESSAPELVSYTEGGKGSCEKAP